MIYLRHSSRADSSVINKGANQQVQGDLPGLLSEFSASSDTAQRWTHPLSIPIPRLAVSLSGRFQVFRNCENMISIAAVEELT